MDKKQFVYNGITFVPYRRWTEKELKAMQRDYAKFCQKINLARDSQLGMWNYENRKVDYNYDDFYKIADSVEAADIFYCKDTGKYYVPCLNEMFMCNVA